jgi:protein-disulfide isomerase
MKKDVYRLGVVAAVAIAALFVAAGYYFRAQKVEREQAAAAAQKSGESAEGSAFVRPHSHALGPKDAKVTVVEFLDPECESCRAIYPMVKHLLSQFEGKVRLVVRYMPFHHNSVYAASALEAAAEQGRYWQMLEILFEKQPEWGSHHAPKPELIPEYAKQIGLDMEAFNKAIGNAKHRELVEIDRADGKRLGVTGTPTFFVNGRMLERLGYEPLQALIAEELGKAK